MEDHASRKHTKVEALVNKVPAVKATWLVALFFLATCLAQFDEHFEQAAKFQFHA